MNEQTKATDQGKTTGRGVFKSRYTAKVCACCDRPVDYHEDGICNPCWTMGAIRKADREMRNPGTIPKPSTRARIANHDRMVKSARQIVKASWAVLESTNPTIDLYKLAIESCRKAPQTNTDVDHLIDDVSEALQIALGDATIKRLRSLQPCNDRQCFCDKACAPIW